MTRPDIRKAETEFVTRAVKNLKKRLVLGSVVKAIPKPRTFHTIDTVVPGVVLVVANLSNTPTNRAKAERILGGPVKTVWEDSTGTAWRKES
jgi:hypothetical protein